MSCVRRGSNVPARTAREDFAMIHVSIHPRRIAGIHADRAAGRDRDHRGADRPAPAGRAVGPRGGPAGPVHQQPQADHAGDRQLCRRQQRRPRCTSTGTRPSKAAPAGNSGTHSWFCGIAPFMEQMTMYNAMNFSYTMEWVYSAARSSAPTPSRYTVHKASIATLLCPSDGVVNTCSGVLAVHQLPARQLQLRGEHRAPAEHPAAGRPAQHGALPPLTGIISMAKMYQGQLFCTAPPIRNHQRERHAWRASPTARRTPPRSANRWSTTARATAPTNVATCTTPPRA